MNTRTKTCKFSLYVVQEKHSCCLVAELLEKMDEESKLLAKVENNFYLFLILYFLQEYVPIHDKVAPRQSWEVDQLLEPTQSGEPLTS